MAPSTTSLSFRCQYLNVYPSALLKYLLARTNKCCSGDRTPPANMYKDRELENHNEQTSTSPDSILVPRRRRPALSCTVCRRRKLKCDRALPCSQCVKSKTPDLCVYSGPAPGQPLETRPIRTASNRANVSSNHTSPAHSGLYVFDSRHQSTNRITKPKGRPEEVQELRHRVQVLESALSKAGSIQTPDSSACESVSDYGPRITSDSLLLSEDVKYLPGRACFRGENGKTRYCGRCHSALSFSFVSGNESCNVPVLNSYSSKTWPPTFKTDACRRSRKARNISN